MFGSFFGIQIGRSALMATMRALEVVSHNVAHASDPAYTRQEAVFRSLPPLGGYDALVTPTGQFGTGVTLGDVIRVRDSFLVRQSWQQLAAEGRARTDYDLLGRVEGVYGEPTAQGLQAVISRWWESWQQLADQPELITARQEVIERSRAMIQAFKAADRDLAELALEAVVAVESLVEEVNGLAGRIANLNSQIMRIEAAGIRANDLRDERDALVQRLIELTGLTPRERTDGGVTLLMGGVPLVDGTAVRTLQAVRQSGPSVTLQWADVTVPVALGEGIMAAYVDLVTNTIPQQRQGLFNLVQDLVAAVDAQHQAGYGLDGVTGRSFFALGATMDTWDLDPAVVADPGAIAASENDPTSPAPAPGGPGDGGNALKIAALRSALIVGGTSTLEEAYRAQVTALGVQVQEAQRRWETAGVLYEQAKRHVQEVSGVSLDEEMTRMVQLQHGYSAAARMVTAVDEMLAVLVERTGLVGR